MVTTLFRLSGLTRTNTRANYFNSQMFSRHWKKGAHRGIRSQLPSRTRVLSTAGHASVAGDLTQRSVDKNRNKRSVFIHRTSPSRRSRCRRHRMVRKHTQRAATTVHARNLHTRASEQAETSHRRSQGARSIDELCLAGAR